VKDALQEGVQAADGEIVAIDIQHARERGREVFEELALEVLKLHSNGGRGHG